MSEQLFSHIRHVLDNYGPLSILEELRAEDEDQEGEENEQYDDAPVVIDLDKLSTEEKMELLQALLQQLQAEEGIETDDCGCD